MIETNSCTEVCWTPVPCPTCGSPLPPRGASTPLETALSDCCAKAQFTPGAVRNPRHLWNEHDSNRAINDPDGWADHVQHCHRDECAGGGLGHGNA